MADVSETFEQFLCINRRQYRILKKIGDGAFSVVYLVQADGASRKLVAKVVNTVRPDVAALVRKEVSIMKRVDHRNIVKFGGFEQTSRRAIILMEFCKGGDLWACLRRRRGTSLSEKAILQVMKGACLSVSVLHGRSPPISHWDIKMDNFLQGDEHAIKLCDFGSCQEPGIVPLMTKKQRNRAKELIEQYTSPVYRAPEQCDFFGHSNLTPKVDIWAIGCVLYCLAFQFHPFRDAGVLGILSGNWEYPKERGKYFSPVIKILLDRCLEKDPIKRADIFEIVERIESALGGKKYVERKKKNTKEEEEVVLNVAHSKREAKEKKSAKKEALRKRRDRKERAALVKAAAANATLPAKRNKHKSKSSIVKNKNSAYTEALWDDDAWGITTDNNTTNDDNDAWGITTDNNTTNDDDAWGITTDNNTTNSTNDDADDAWGITTDNTTTDDNDTDVWGSVVDNAAFTKSKPSSFYTSLEHRAEENSSESSDSDKISNSLNDDTSVDDIFVPVSYNEEYDNLFGDEDNQPSMSVSNGVSNNGHVKNFQSLNPNPTGTTLFDEAMAVTKKTTTKMNLPHSSNATKIDAAFGSISLQSTNKYDSYNPFSNDAILNGNQYHSNKPQNVYQQQQRPRNAAGYFNTKTRHNDSFR